MSDELKSAVELAMEKVQKQGGPDPVRLSDEQKERIAEIRKKFKARIAQEEITTQGQIQKARLSGDVDAAERARRKLLGEKARLQEALEREIQKIRAE